MVAIRLALGSMVYAKEAWSLDFNTRRGTRAISGIWEVFLELVVHEQSLRNQLMVFVAYDGALTAVNCSR